MSSRYGNLKAILRSLIVNRYWAKIIISMLTQYLKVIQDTPGKTTWIEHTIVTTDSSPVRLPPYRLPYAYREPVKAEIDSMLEHGIIEPSNSEWSAPIVIVKKRDDTLRLCVDYRQLNSVSVMDAYPMPRIDELIDKLVNRSPNGNRGQG